MAAFYFLSLAFSAQSPVAVLGNILHVLIVILQDKIYVKKCGIAELLLLFCLQGWLAWHQTNTTTKYRFMHVHEVVSCICISIFNSIPAIQNSESSQFFKISLKFPAQKIGNLHYTANFPP